MITGDMIVPGTCIKYIGDHGILYTGIVALVNKRTIKDSMILILENGIHVSILDVLEISDSKDKCMTCDGQGIVYISSKYGPSGKCVVCGGSGKNKEYMCQKCGGSKIKDEHNRACVCDLNKKEDMVNSPKHYTFGTIEVIDVIEDWGLDKEFYLANVIKYIARAKHKGDELESYKKAQWYLSRKIERMELKIAAVDDNSNGH